MQLYLKNFKYSIFLSLLLIPLYYFFLYSNMWNIFKAQTIFGDLKLNILWLKCNYEGFKVFEDNSCNFVKTNYGPTLFLIPFNEKLEIFYIKFLPYITYLIFIFSSILVNNPKNLIQSSILFIFIYNPAVFLLLERMNFDVFIFLLLVFIIYNRFFLLNWITIIFLGLTKIYPFIFGINIFIENLKRSKKNLICIFLFISLTSLTYILLNLDEYFYVLTSTGGKAGLHFLFSIKSVSKILKYALDINYIISLPIILGFFYFLIKKIIFYLNRENITEFLDLESNKLKLFFVSGLTIVLCYIFFSNYLYREAFFILMLPFINDLFFNKKISYIKILLLLFVVKFIFQFVYGYFNIFDSFYHVNYVRFYSFPFLLVSLIKGILDFLVVAFITSIIVIIIKEYYKKIKLINVL